MVLCKTLMLLFVSVWCYAKPRCYYSCPNGVMQNLDAIIRVGMVLLFRIVSVFLFSNARFRLSYNCLLISVEFFTGIIMVF